jgi:hypothetical protein
VVLAMIASVEAIFLSTFVLTSQNRMAAAAVKRADPTCRSARSRSMRSPNSSHCVGACSPDGGSDRDRRLITEPDALADGALQAAHRPACGTLENWRFPTNSSDDMLF